MTDPAFTAGRPGHGPGRPVSSFDGPRGHFVVSSTGQEFQCQAPARWTATLLRGGVLRVNTWPSPSRRRQARTRGARVQDPRSRDDAQDGHPSGASPSRRPAPGVQRALSSLTTSPALLGPVEQHAIPRRSRPRPRTRPALLPADGSSNAPTEELLCVHHLCRTARRGPPAGRRRRPRRRTAGRRAPGAPRRHRRRSHGRPTPQPVDVGRRRRGRRPRRDVRQRPRHQPRLGLADLHPLLRHRDRHAGSRHDDPAHRPRDGRRLRAGPRPGGDAPVAQRVPAHRCLGLHLGVPVDPAHRAAALLVQHRLPLPDHQLRAAVRTVVRQRLDQRPLRGSRRRGARSRPAPGGLRGGDHPRRHPLRRRGAARGGIGPRHPPTSPVHEDRAAAGDALDPAQRRQRGDQPLQGHVDRLGPRHPGALLPGAGDLRPQLPGRAAAPRRDGLVHHPHDAAHDRAVLRRATLRPGQRPLRSRRRRSSGCVPGGPGLPLKESQDTRRPEEVAR